MLVWVYNASGGRWRGADFGEACCAAGPKRKWVFLDGENKELTDWGEDQCVEVSGGRFGVCSGEGCGAGL